MTHLTVAFIFLLLLDASSCFLTNTRPSILRGLSLKSAPTDTADVVRAIELGRDRLQTQFSFSLDDWQLQAGGEIVQGHNVIVCAPTGAGKTVVGEMALHLALEAGKKAVYTTPLKALSNQKFAELRQTFGKATVGLSTGDMSVNRDAHIRVMTTEVYRNMAWRSSGLDEYSQTLLLDDELSNNGVVVLDEFHYMGQPGRGGVWEESVITTPSHSQIVGLSATLPNAVQLAQWMESVSGRKTVLVEAAGARPVPLRYLFATKRGLYPLFRDENAGPGAPNGLLGLRGDGPREEATRSKSAKQSPAGEDETIEGSAIPRGLEINPILQAAAQKRRMRVNSAIERLKAAETEGGDRGWEKDNWRAEPRRTRLTAREERRQREQLLKREMRKEVPSLGMLVQRLDQKNLLPAIVFIFSRAGCDNSAQQVCQQLLGPARNPFSAEMDEDDVERVPKSKSRSRGKKANGRTLQDEQGRSFRRGSSYVDDEDLLSMLEGVFSDDHEEMEFNHESPLNSENWPYFATAGLLRFDQVKDVAARVSAFNVENEEIAFDDDAVEQFLCGIGSHHAGMLPAHKAFVETLYQAQLMKLVFATETLAAGINMPARTTCICALAKRGNGSSMNLLETSNLLQMAGRAGRRGMDTAGTCVIMSTPFENEDDAANILISEIKPITSQFAPSYSLAVNLIARGQGRVEVARRLVEKSFAMWVKRQVDESLATAVQENGVTELLAAASHDQFVTSLIDAFDTIIKKRTPGFDIQSLKAHVDMMQDRNAMKRSSKQYTGALNRVEVERKTLEYLNEEMKNTEGFLTAGEQEIFGDLADEDQVELLRQVETQRTRLLSAEGEINQNPLSALADAANRIMEGSDPSSKTLQAQLEGIRTVAGEEIRPLSGEDLSVFIKSMVAMKQTRKKVDTLDSNELVKQANQVSVGRDATWRDMLALTKVLVSYGCLMSDWVPGDNDNDLEASSFELTPAGEHIGMLSFENSLWALVAMGGAHDVLGVSSELDEFRRKLKDFGSSFDEYDDDAELLDGVFSKTDKTSFPDAEQESLTLATQLSELKTHELAGYVSCLLADGFRRSNSMSVAESFQSLTPAQQRVTQSALSVCERLIEVQKQCGTGDTNTRCDLDLSNVRVVTAWAEGCSWSQALEISGAAPGDLARLLGRVLDALRQFGNLSFHAVRSSDMEGGGATKSRGVSSELRNKCRDAARAMNRYPVKDPLPFDTDSSEVDDGFYDDEEEIFDDDGEILVEGNRGEV